MESKTYLDQVPEELLYLILSYLDDLDQIEEIVKIDYQKLFNYRNFEISDGEDTPINLYRILKLILNRDHYLAKKVNRGWKILYDDINNNWEKIPKDIKFYYYNGIYKLNSLTIECLLAIDLYITPEYVPYVKYVGLLPLSGYTYQIFFILLQNLEKYLNFPSEGEGSLDKIFGGEYSHIGNPSINLGSESVLMVYYFLMFKTVGLTEQQKRLAIHIEHGLYNIESIYNSFYIKLYKIISPSIWH